MAKQPFWTVSGKLRLVPETCASNGHKARLITRLACEPKVKTPDTLLVIATLVASLTVAAVSADAPGARQGDLSLSPLAQKQIAAVEAEIDSIEARTKVVYGIRTPPDSAH